MEKKPLNKLEIYNARSETYHNRFRQLCTDQVTTLASLSDFTTRQGGQLPQDYINEFNPLFGNFRELFEDFKECMMGIKNNQVAFMDIALQELDLRDKKIGILENIISNNELINKINEDIIEAVTTGILDIE